MWERALPDEAAFWAKELPERIRTLPAYRARMRPDAPVSDGFLARYLDRIDGDPIRVIDVGCGPLTAVGKRHGDRVVEVTAVDPLAEEYNRAMDQAGIEPPVRPRACPGEDLLELFAPGSFDVAYARNAIDHGYDPLRTIEGMLALVAPSGYVVLEHLPREASRNCYRNLHQWDMTLEDGRLVLERAGARLDVSARLADRADLHCESLGGWICCALRARA